jgi:hypothetical protein
MDSWSELAEQAERVEGGPAGFQEEKRRLVFIEKAGARSDGAQKVDFYNFLSYLFPQSDRRGYKTNSLSNRCNLGSKPLLGWWCTFERAMYDYVILR